MQPTAAIESLADTARHGSGLATVYRALDHVVSHYELHDAAVVVDIPGMGLQVLHAGRRPLHNDEQRLHEAEPGLYLDPARDDPVLDQLMLAVTELAFRYDTRAEVEAAPS